jgi:hypothetical protein
MQSFFQPQPLPSKLDALKAIKTNLTEAGVFNLIMVSDEAEGAEELRFFAYNLWLLNFSDPKGPITGDFCFNKNRDDDFNHLLKEVINDLDKLLDVYEEIVWYLARWKDLSELEHDQKEKHIYPVTNLDCDSFLLPKQQYQKIKPKLETLQDNILVYFKMFIESGMQIDNRNNTIFFSKILTNHQYSASLKQSHAETVSELETNNTRPQHK